jgi:multidrug efflux pump subunit AcrB
VDVVRAVNSASLILPSGDVKIGRDYAIFTNSLFRNVPDISRIPLKAMANGSMVRVSDVGRVEDGSQIQSNIVQVDGQRSAYVPIMKQGGDTNTIAVVNGIKSAVSRLLDIPPQLRTDVVFDQSQFVKNAIETLADEGSIGLVLTGVMVLVFLGSMRATVGVFLAIPMSVFAALIALYVGGSSINTMILAGFALVFTPHRQCGDRAREHLPPPRNGRASRRCGGKGRRSVSGAAATLTSSVVFFPVTFLYSVSSFLFSALALAVVLALFASTSSR